MKTFLAILTVSSIALSLSAAPVDNVGRVLPRLALLTGEVYTKARILSADAEGMTVATETGEIRVSRYALPLDARVALGYPEEPDRIPWKGYFRVVQTGKGGYVVRKHNPPPAAGSMQAFTNEVFGRAMQTEGDDEAQRLFLAGKADGTIADGEIIQGTYIDLDETKLLKDALTGAAVSLRSLTLLSGSRHHGR